MNIVFCGAGYVGQECEHILQNYKLKYIKCELKKNIIDFLQSIGDVDLILSVHWPFLFNRQEINYPKIGVLNLHNSYLPWNKGADACSWAIIDGTPHGATMHWIDSGIDTGDIFYQEKVDILIEDTTDSLYKKTVETELIVFKKTIQLILDKNFIRNKQIGFGSFHKKSDFKKIIRAANTSNLQVVEINK